MHILMRDRRGCRWATGLCVLLTCVHAEALPRCELLYLDIGRSHCLHLTTLPSPLRTTLLVTHMRPCVLCWQAATWATRSRTL